MPSRFFLLLFAVLVMAGANLAHSQVVQEDDPSNPHYKAAQQALDNNNPNAAAAEYESALAANPKLAGAHYQLGLLYAEKLQDPISSIYHLKKFLAVAPTSDHAATAKQLIDQEGQSYAASLPDSSASKLAQMSKLQDENSGLKKQVEDARNTITQLQGQLATAGVHRPETSAPVPGVAPMPTGPQRALPLDSTNFVGTPAAPAGTPGAPATPIDTTNARSYTVVKGDSLWKIAHKMYPKDTKNGVDKIQEANKDAIGGKPLKIGQVLVIP